MEITYRDTRDRAQEQVSCSEAILHGLAPGGGLYVPERIPQLSLDDIKALGLLSYAQRAASIYKRFHTDFTDEEIDELMALSYGDNFDTEQICPIHSLDADTHVLELWHGPTSAFKDMALQCLPHVFAKSAQKQREAGLLDHEFLILVATSGDTGKAALQGFSQVEGLRVAVLYPRDGVSEIQRRQMVTQKGDNVAVWAVEGNFDTCQALVKQAFSDADFAEILQKKSAVALSSANSINWGRLLPQIVYYVSAYAQLVTEEKISLGQEIDVCVPTGNFGNILAAWYAKHMGVPIDMLLCASNENKVLSDFIATGRYDISDRAFVQTPSPSMDILVSSNLERQLFELCDRDGSRIAAWMDDLAKTKAFRLDPESFARLRTEFSADWVSNEECLDTIREVYTTHDYLVDPHTAVAVKVAERLRSDNPVLIASTAHWAKFGEDVARALQACSPGEELVSPLSELDSFALNEQIARLTGSSIPHELAHLKQAEIRFTNVLPHDLSRLESEIVEFCTTGKE